jgi:hypothetical protein
MTSYVIVYKSCDATSYVSALPLSYITGLKRTEVTFQKPMYETQICQNNTEQQALKHLLYWY